MSVDANALERETLERKDRDELQKIAGALGGKVTSRTRKADIIDQILELTGVTSSDSSAGSGAKPGADADEDASEATGDATDDDAATPSRNRPGGQQSGRQQSGRQQSGSRSGGPQSGQQRAGSRSSAAKDDSGKQDSGKQDSGKQDSGKQDSGKQDSGEARSARNDRNDDGGQDDDGGQGSDDVDSSGRRRRRRGRNRDAAGQQDEFTGEPIAVVGCLDLRDDGYGFLRVDGLLPSKDDCYVSVKQVRQFGLRKGDVVAGGSRPAFRNEKNPAILRIDTVNDVDLEPGTERPLFEELTATFATDRIDLATDEEADRRTMRALDLLAPIGKGSRVLVAAPPRTGKTTLLQAFARSIEANDPAVSLMVVLLDERPEEITEMARVVAGGTVHGSPFDANPDEHVALLDLALARARRMAEGGDDVVVLLDGLTRLARAEHSSGQSTGRTLGGLDATAVQAAKRAFGAGRNLEEAGSVTVVATATIDTGSGIDDAVYDAVVGASTTQIRLDRDAAERRSFPALDVGRTSTRREELLVGDDGVSRREALRRVLAGLPTSDSADHADGLDGLLGRLRNTKSNDVLLKAAVKEDA
ncbi:MAG: transcription termination factor Rho [Acidimicrobiales bacterium]